MNKTSRTAIRVTFTTLYFACLIGAFVTYYNDQMLLLAAFAWTGGVMSALLLQEYQMARARRGIPHA